MDSIRPTSSLIRNGWIIVHVTDTGIQIFRVKHVCTSSHYRYNVSGRDTVLNVHYCAIQGSSDCISESYRTTEGEEYCNILRPFLRGQNLYSFYFGLDSLNPLYRPKDGLSGRIQGKNETIAAVLVLKANQCHEIC